MESPGIFRAWRDDQDRSSEAVPNGADVNRRGALAGRYLRRRPLAPDAFQQAREAGMTIYRG